MNCLAGMLTDAEKAAMRATTHDAALVLIDDLEHIRQIISKEEPDPGDLRRMSNVLRRILIEGDLRKIATPRLGKIAIIGPDLRSFYRENEREPYQFLAADTFVVHGISFSAFSFDPHTPTRQTGYRPGNLVPLRVEPFQNQQVLCYKGKWVTRADLIKYVANVGHGTHSGTPNDDRAFLIRIIRHCLTIGVETDGSNGKQVATVTYNSAASSNDDPPIKFRPDVVDLPLLYLISTAQFLTSSPDVVELERVIKESG